MIREPYNINPYNSTIDTSKVNNFGFTFSGDELGSWKVEIAKNNTSPDIVYTSKEFVPSDVGYEHIYDGDRVEGMTLPSTIAHNQEDDGLLRRLYDIVGYPYNTSVVRLAVNDINDLGKIKGSTSDGYLVATTYSLGRENENVTILGYDENGVVVGSEVTNGTYNFLGYLLTVKANSNIQPGQKVQIEGNTFTIGDIEDTQDGYYELMITNGTGSFSGDAAIVTFDTLASAEVTELKIALSPKQDLHGYDNPWPSGGGVNLLDPSARTQYSASGLRWWESDGYTLKANQSYTFKYFQITDESCALYIRRKSDGETIAQQSLTLTYTPTEDVLVYLQAYRTNISLDEERFIFVKGTTAPSSWSPYSNICPIYPSNGKNLLPLSNGTYSLGATGASAVVENGKVTISGTTTSSGGRTTRLSDYFTLKAGTYTISPQLTASPYIRIYINKKSDSTVIGYNQTITLTEDTEVYVGIDVESGYTYNKVIYPQIELGSTATPYVPYQGINLYQQGKNVLPNDLTWTSGLRNDSGTQTSSSVSHYSSPFPVRPSTQYTLQGILYNTTNYRAYYLDANCGWISRSISLGNQVERITTPENCYYMQVQCANELDLSSNAQIEEGATATTIEPYNGTTYPLSLGQSVYGGTIDVVSGKLVVDKVMVTLDGSQDVTTMNNGTSNWYYQISGIPDSIDQSKPTLSNMYQSNQITNSNTLLGIWRTSGGAIRIRTNDQITSADYKAWLSSNNVQVLSTLASPLEYDLTPTQISTLIDANNIWSSGNILNVTFSYEES